jgi:hypothetical protein
LLKRDLRPAAPAIAQTVSRWLPTAPALVRARVWSSGIYGGQSGAGAGFLRVVRFPMSIFIPQNSPSSQSPGTSTVGQNWPTCRVDPVWTQPNMRIKKCCYPLGLQQCCRRIGRRRNRAIKTGTKYIRYKKENYEYQRNYYVHISIMPTDRIPRKLCDYQPNERTAGADR